MLCLYIYRGLLLAAVRAKALFDKSGQFVPVRRRNIRKLDAHAGRSRIAVSFRPDDTRVNGHDFRIAGQLKMQGYFSIDRQEVTACNKSAAAAHVDYAGICVEAGRAGYELQVGVYASRLPALVCVAHAVSFALTAFANSVQQLAKKLSCGPRERC